MNKLKRYAPYQGGMDESELGDYYLASDVDAELARLRECEKALKTFIGVCDSAPPISFVTELGKANEQARRALGGRATK